MAPLPLFHRPLSQDNSRETSLSSGRGGGRSTGPDTSGSGSGVSLPMRGLANNGMTPTTPDTPSTTLTHTTIPNASSSDYLIGKNIKPQKWRTNLVCMYTKYWLLWRINPPAAIMDRLLPRGAWLINYLLISLYSQRRRHSKAVKTSQQTPSLSEKYRVSGASSLIGLSYDWHAGQLTQWWPREQQWYRRCQFAPFCF